MEEIALWTVWAGWASLLVATIALGVAAAALLHDRAQGRSAAVAGHVGRPPVKHSKQIVDSPEGTQVSSAVGSHDVWEVSIDLIGPGDMHGVAFAMWGDEDNVEAFLATSALKHRVWRPGDEPMSVRFRVSQPGPSTDLWVGMSWIEPRRYTIGVIAHARRWPLSQLTDDGDIQRWSHRRGKWVRERRHCLLPRVHTGWTHDMFYPGVERSGSEPT